MKKNRTSGGTTQTINTTQASVSAILAGPENRLARSQPEAPARAAGGGSRSAGRARR